MNHDDYPDCDEDEHDTICDACSTLLAQSEGIPGPGGETLCADCWQELEG